MIAQLEPDGSILHGNNLGERGCPPPGCYHGIAETSNKMHNLRHGGSCMSTRTMQTAGYGKGKLRFELAQSPAIILELSLIHI